MSSRLIPLVSIFFFILTSLNFPLPAYAWKAVVIRVVDGDTLFVAPKDAKNFEQIQIDVRLYGIDAPELKQPGGQESKVALEQLVSPNSPVEIVSGENDRYDRAVGLVIIDGIFLNFEQIRCGHAWVYEKYCRARFCNKMKQAEKEARHAKQGLWAEENSVPPWKWRKR